MQHEQGRKGLFGSQFWGVRSNIVGKQQKGFQLWEQEVAGHISAPVGNLGDE